jgi:UDP-glucose 4-epimerase
MKCLVTGGAGFIGSNLVDRLIADGHQVTIFDDLSTGFEENINPKATFYKVDISNMDDYYPFYFNDVDVIFHLACLARVQPSIENPMEYHKTNVNGTLNLLEMARKFNIKRFVFSSSSSVYGDVEEKDLPTIEESNLNPMSPYALHKLIGEQYCKLYSKLYDLETVCLRYFNVYGERQNTEGAYCLVMGVFAGQLLNGGPMTINGDGEQLRDFTYVGDVVDANIKCATTGIMWNGDVINIGAGDNRSVNDVADLLGGKRVHRDPVIEPRKTLAHNGKASFILNWKPTQNFEEWVIKWKKDLGL